MWKLLIAASDGTIDARETEGDIVARVERMETDLSRRDGSLLFCFFCRGEVSSKESLLILGLCTREVRRRPLAEGKVGFIFLESTDAESGESGGFPVGAAEGGGDGEGERGTSFERRFCADSWTYLWRSLFGGGGDGDFLNLILVFVSFSGSGSLDCKTSHSMRSVSERADFMSFTLLDIRNASSSSSFDKF